MDICRIFNSRDFSLRTLKKNGKIYFNGFDLAADLGYKKPRNAIQTLVAEKDKIYVTTALPQGGGYKAVYITRPAASKFAFQCRLPAAEKYCDWLSEEVLESIYDTGKYEWEEHSQFKAIADKIDRDTPNFEDIKQICEETVKKLKDPVKQERGRRGGQACQQKYRKMRKELRQTKIDLTLFHLKEKLAEKCKDEIEKQG